MKNQLWDIILKVRSVSPLVQNITNYVVMNNTANALLAAGASPIMAHAPEEMEDMQTICSALVVNIGTLSTPWIDAMEKAMLKAKKMKHPIVFDPVGAGATHFRNETIKKLLTKTAPDFIRGNASEIMSVAGISSKTKGVDSTEQSTNAVESARLLSEKYNCVVCISGETDIIVQGHKTAFVHNGHEMMTRVTGLGCSSSALLGAFSVVEDDPFMACLAETIFMGICGELAQKTSNGPGSLQVNIIDKFANLTKEEFFDNVKFSYKI